MSVLEIRKVTGGVRCAVPDCTRSGRCEYYLIGLPTVINGRRELICEPCSREWQRAFAELAPSRERLLEVLGELRGSVSERVDAIDTLADLGLAQEYRAFAVRETDAGLEPEEILELILGARELEAVA